MTTNTRKGLAKRIQPPAAPGGSLSAGAQRVSPGRRGAGAGPLAACYAAIHRAPPARRLGQPGSLNEKPKEPP